jgi:hypothetical protein
VSLAAAQGQTTRFNVLRLNETATATCSAVLTYFDGVGTVARFPSSFGPSDLIGKGKDTRTVPMPGWVKRWMIGHRPRR